MDDLWKHFESCVRTFGCHKSAAVAAAILLCNLEAAIIDKEVLKSYAGLILHRDLEFPLDQASPSTPISTLPNQLRSPPRPSDGDSSLLPRQLPCSTVRFLERIISTILPHCLKGAV